MLTLDHDELAEIAASRVVRGWTEEDCRAHLDRDTCPEPPSD